MSDPRLAVGVRRFLTRPPLARAPRPDRRASTTRRRFQFPFISAIIVFVGWFFVTDLVSNGGNWSAVVTLLLGLAYCRGGGPRPIIRPRSGCTSRRACSIGGALLYWWHSSDWNWALLAVAALVYVALGVRARRSSWSGARASSGSSPLRPISRRLDVDRTAPDRERQHRSAAALGAARSSSPSSASSFVTLGPDWRAGERPVRASSSLQFGAWNSRFGSAFSPCRGTSASTRPCCVASAPSRSRCACRRSSRASTG